MSDFNHDISNWCVENFTNNTAFNSPELNANPAFVPWGVKHV